VRARRLDRFQVVDEQGDGWLLLLEQQRWVVEAATTDPAPNHTRKGPEMGCGTNPPVSWAQLERALSGAPLPAESELWKRREAPPLPERAPGPVVPYAELHVHSHYSFLDGASSPEQLVAEATRLGLHGIGLTDHDGLYGIVRMAEAAEVSTLKTVFGAELSLGLSKPQNGEPDPEGDHLVVLARREEGYHRLAGAHHHRAAGRRRREGATGLRPGCTGGGGIRSLAGADRMPQGRGASRSLVSEGTDAAAREVDRLVDLFGRDNVVVELFDQGNPLDSTHNDALAGIAARAGLPYLATNVAHYASPADAQLAAALAAVRAHRSLDELDGWLPASDGAHLRSGAEMAARFARYPGAVERTVEVADDLSFQLRAVRPKLPKQEVPAGHTPMSWLRELVWKGVEKHYPNAAPSVHERIEKELAVIEAKDFPGYFLIVHDIVQFARGRGILCQGRGSAANSAVCYALDITAVDSIFYDLPFERFLSSLREEEPDIDVDFDSDRREEVIQHVYEKYGRRNAAQVANVISYRPKNAVRDMAKALGFSPGQQDAWSKQIDSWTDVSAEGNDIPQPVVDLARQVLRFPRHLGIHSGGMVLTDRPVGEVCPIEHARMENRTVLQWDKDDCAWMGLVKFDLLGLGMLAALQYAFDLIDESLGERWTIGSIPARGGRRLRHALPGGCRRCVPGGEPRPDGDTPPAETTPLLRPGGGDRAHPPRPDPGRCRAPVHPSAHRRGGGDVPASAARTGAGAHARRSPVPGAAHADGCRGRRLHSGRCRPASPGDGLQARH
jgi:error-prone DNA polymerase